MSEYKTIKVKLDTYNKLYAYKRPFQSWDFTLNRLLDVFEEKVNKQ